LLLFTILAASACFVVSSAGAPSSPVPRVEQQRIVASFGQTYLPGFLPPGYIFVNWSSEPGSASVYGDFLEVSFGRHGSKLQWVVGDARDPNYYGKDGCSRHPFNPKIYWVGNRRIIYQAGNHGATATLCLRGRGGAAVAVYAWDDFGLTPQALAQFVASARVFH
jgi:hypothetical protein